MYAMAALEFGNRSQFVSIAYLASFVKGGGGRRRFFTDYSKKSVAQRGNRGIIGK